VVQPDELYGDTSLGRSVSKLEGAALREVKQRSPEEMRPLSTIFCD